MRVSRRGRATWLALAVVLLAPAASAEPAKAPKPPAAPLQADDVLRAMSKFLAAQKAFSYHGEVEFDQIVPGGLKLRLSGAVDVAVARPGSLFVDYRDDVSDRVVWLQNGLLTVLDPVAGTYAQISGPKDIDGMVEMLQKEYGMSLPLGEFAESDPQAVLTRGVDLAHYVGVHNVEGAFCHHLLLQRPDLDLQVWVQVGDKPLPRKLAFEYPEQVGHPQYEVTITEWTLKAPKAEIFAPKIPKGAGKVDLLPIGKGR